MARVVKKVEAIREAKEEAITKVEEARKSEKMNIIADAKIQSIRADVHIAMNG